MRAALRAGERLLFGFGVLCLLVYASACVHARVDQARRSDGFDQELAGLRSGGQALTALLAAGRPDQHEWSSVRRKGFAAHQGDSVETLGRLDIPTAGVSVMVLEGTADGALELGAGHIEGTAEPGEPGNLGIAGHRDGYFRGLRHVELGDTMTLATRYGVGRYEVDDLRVVDPEQVEVLEPSDESRLTLVTCYPFYYVGAAPKRYVVRARRTAFQPWTREVLEQYLASRQTEEAGYQAARAEADASH